MDIVWPTSMMGIPSIEQIDKVTKRGPSREDEHGAAKSRPLPRIKRRRVNAAAYSFSSSPFFAWLVPPGI